MSRKDEPSSTVCAHPDKYSPTGYPSHGQMSQESAVDNKTHSQKYVPPCIEKNERGTECKSPKDAIKFSEYSSICKGDMSQENSFADACASNDSCISPMGGSQQEEDIHDNVKSVTSLQLSEYSHDIFDICPVQKKGVKLAPSFLVKNRELRKERAIGQDFLELRPGMIHTRKYIRHSDQIMSQQHSSDRGSQGTIEDRFEQFVQSQTRINTQILEILSRMTQQPRTSQFPPVVTPRELDQYELFERFCKRKPSEFSGCGDPMEADAWIIEMERIFRMLLCTGGQRVHLVTYMLRDAAEVWWMTVRASYTDMDDAVAWETFKEQFLRKFIPAPVRSQKLQEFMLLLQGDMTVPKDGPSATVCAHPDKYSPTGYPSHGQMSQESAVDNKTHSQKYVPPCIEKNERGTECKSRKDAFPLKSSEFFSICKGDMSQENSFADACASNDYCISPMGGSQQEEDIHDNVMGVTTLQLPEYSHDIFDICPIQKKGVKLAPSFLVKNRELRKERAIGQDFLELRPGMILMKKYIRHSDQVELIKTCRELGIGSGGFYRPGYSNGAKLRLWMMCLGKNWDPEGREYEERRSMDNVKPPVIPETFNKLVERAIQDAHAFIKTHSNVSSVEAVLPNMTPDVCIVKFYTDTGKVGLHQDRDESPESLHRELPIVSFSLGDSAEFLYGDDRDVDKANKVTLESGDVLIFGGKSRHIYHGVPLICSKTAPELLVNETSLRPGRLNLTFRQY